MTIRIVDEPEIVLSRKEYDQLTLEYKAYAEFNPAPMLFEEWVRYRRRTGQPDVSGPRLLEEGA